MEPHNRGLRSEDEYFARRYGELERERNERHEREGAADAPPLPMTNETPITAPEPTEGAKTASKIVATMSTAMRVIFGIRGRRRRGA